MKSVTVDPVNAEYALNTWKRLGSSVFSPPGALMVLSIAFGVAEFLGGQRTGTPVRFPIGAAGFFLLAAGFSWIHRRARREQTQMHTSLAESEFLLQGTLDGFPGHAAVIAENGTLLAVNCAWREIMAGSGESDSACGVGANIFRSSLFPDGRGPDDHRMISKGLKKLLSGQIHSFSHEYPCHGPECWFMARASRFSQGRRNWIVVSHEEITERKQAEMEVQRLHSEQFEQVRRDPLTGLGNRLRLHEDLEVMKARLERYGHAYSIVLFDIDHFKAYNDRYGHRRGDETLAAVARTLQEHGRKGDTIYRYGGEEFMVILPEQTQEDAAIVANRIRRAVEALDLPHLLNPPTGTVTISAGISAVGRDERKTVEDLIEEADDALCVAKEAGRNRVRTYQPLSFHLQAA
ncbi:MAG: sensor domain-containing diguanylate cyclase [Armatimonadetes bacterium]|nr:sensor domain-containing diguanylate cyclase [Armatimonadota bacterium]